MSDTTLRYVLPPGPTSEELRARAQPEKTTAAYSDFVGYLSRAAGLLDCAVQLSPLLGLGDELSEMEGRLDELAEEWRRT